MFQVGWKILVLNKVIVIFVFSDFRGLSLEHEVVPLEKGCHFLDKEVRHPKRAQNMSNGIWFFSKIPLSMYGEICPR